MEIEALQKQEKDTLIDSLQNRVTNLNDAIQAHGADVPYLVNELERASELYSRLLSDQGRWDTPQDLSKRIVEKMLARELPGANQGQAAVVVNALMGRSVNQAARTLYEIDEESLVKEYKQTLGEDEEALPAQIQALKNVLRQSPSVELDERMQEALAKAAIAKDLNDENVRIDASPEHDSVVIHCHLFEEEREFSIAPFFDSEEGFEPQDIFANHTLSQAIAHKAKINIETDGYTARTRLDNATSKLVNP